MNDIWQKSPLNLTLELDDVHIWSSPLDLPESEVTALSQCLSPDEQARASQFKFEQHRRRFIVARGKLRHILATYTQIKPEKLEFSYSDRGKPSLILPSNYPKLEFNLSHSGELAIYGITRDRAIGIDVEYLRPVSDVQQIAKRFFSSSEFNLIENSAESAKNKLFFQIWTAKEAYLKAIGQGISGGLSQIEVKIEQHHQLSLIKGNITLAWSVTILPLPSAYLATVVVEGYHHQYYYWKFSI